jgi:cytolysin-activating lysine-acyltransferase
MLSFGQLSMLASYCPLHKQFPAQALARLFIPAINHDCVRFFSNEDDQVCAALIWARLSDDVSERMIYDQIPPQEKDWVSGTNLWFLDILAPFGHGRVVAQHIAREPPEGPFYFARLGKAGKTRKVVRGDASMRVGRVRSYHLDQLAR